MGKSIIGVSAIIAIAGLTGYAMALGYDGVLFMASLAIIGGIAGYNVAKIVQRK